MFESKSWANPLTTAERGLSGVSEHVPAAMFRPPPWNLDQFVLIERLFKSDNSTLHKALDKQSGKEVALKSYKKKNLTKLNM